MKHEMLKKQILELTKQYAIEKHSEFFPNKINSNNKAINGASTTPYLGEFSSAPSASVVNSTYYNLSSNKLFYSNGSAWFEETTVNDDFVSSEYTTGIYVQTPSVNATGSGKVLQIGLNAFVWGKPYSIQSVDISVLLGRTK